MSKRGRNDPCWCGSGKKFKRCHQNRAASLKEFKKTVHGWNKAVFHRGDCLHPLAEKGACSGTVIASHTLQRRRVLEAIAENGHVGHLDLEEDWSPQTPIRPHPVSVVKVGLSRASTFPGFCAAHDATTFSAIEQGTWEPEAYPLFLLSYRSICRELFHKQKRLEWLQLMKRWVEGSELLDPEEVGSFLDPQLHWTRIGLKQLKRTKTQYDRALIHDGTDEFQFYAIRTQPVPTVVVTGASLVEADFSGCLIQNVGSSRNRVGDFRAF
jgi:hypothetical protein